MRRFFVMIFLLVVVFFLYLLMAVKDDQQWLNDFKNSTIKSNSLQVHRIPIDTLVHQYSSLHGRSVEVEGYLNFEFEDVSICTRKTIHTSMSRLDGRGKCFSLVVNLDPRDLKDSLALKLKGLIGHKVTLRGTIDTNVFERGDYLASIVFEQLVQL